jgi:murein DD-endopeptidase MepM/ murein hydrolase activator NlpD
MHILLVPDNRICSRHRCLHPRQVAILGLLALVVLPLGLGALGYYVSAALGRGDAPQLDPAYVARLETDLHEQKQRIETAKAEYDTHLNALAVQLGKIQAQVLRINALGQRLTTMAGLDEGEFNFSEEPAVGGPEQPAPLAPVQVPDFLQSLDTLSYEVDQRITEIEMLETLMMDRQLQAAMKPVGWPVEGGYVSSSFGYRQDPFTGRKAFHDGVDIANRAGAAVKAIASGVVTHAGMKSGYGRLVEINHGSGYVTRYAHTRKILVNVGEKVEKGQEIALVGSSGRSTGPHLHFEILRNGKAVNPRTYLRAAR